MQSVTIDQTACKAIEWDGNYFKYCDMAGFSKEGGIISSDFVGCTFSDVEWYWGIFTLANFIKCKFINCTFRGTSFADARFVECTIDNCRFIKDNLNGECDFSRAIAYACAVNGGEGFSAERKA